MKSKRSRLCDFSPETKQEIRERDGGCIFCKIGFKMPPLPMPTQIAHIVPRSQGGLGVAQNGVVLCIHHHVMMDNGNDGERQRMIGYCEWYMKHKYPRWNKEDLVYDKWKDFKG